ncbi:endoplasmin homolog [Copidosoma floridanum]|uniref:endoplasmin homolog n=1 Tax=Copidosoma floridanum TaxID=29053 RepID=UPI0006C9812E|nr:endoplasmin homolog [Copidosoma floridanum]
MKAVYIVAVLCVLAGLIYAEDLLNENEVCTGEDENCTGQTASDAQNTEDSPTTYQFQAKVSRMMKLIINSLYRNKEIFLRELVSNASDALDKIRLLMLTVKNAIDQDEELSIWIKADKENKILSITDNGIGMTKQDLINNLGTLAKSGTAEFLEKLQDSNFKEMNDMIGQFGVGFYSAFLVADKVAVTSKHDDDKQYVWESDSSSFSIVEDPKGNTLKRGTTVSLYLKDEATDFLETDTLKNLIKKYSQFINFPIYLWNSKVIEVEKDAEEEDKVETNEVEKQEELDEDDVKIEESTEPKEKKKEKSKKTVWDWELLNDLKPIWTYKPSEISDERYNEFYRNHTKDTQDPLIKSHFHAEGEVTFKSLLFIPKIQPSESFNRYGTKTDSIKLYVRRVFISDTMNDLLPNYLSFIQGIVDSDDLPLNVSRENLQQHKLLKIIKKKLIRKILDTLRKLSKEDHIAFWKEYSTNIKLGIIEDSQNRARLSKLLLFHTSAHDNLTTLAEYVSRKQPDQKRIYYVAGTSLEEVKKSPFIEKLVSKGFEVLYLIEAVDEHTLSYLPEFDGIKIQNAAKEIPDLDDSNKKELTETFKPLIDFFEELFKENVTKVQISDRLTNSPCALVANMFGWTGNMERLAISNAFKKSEDPQKAHFLNQKKTLEINPDHPLIKELLHQVESNREDDVLENISWMLYNTATLRSGYILREPSDFADSTEELMLTVLRIPSDKIPQDHEEL